MTAGGGEVAAGRPSRTGTGGRSGADLGGPAGVIGGSSWMGTGGPSEVEGGR